MSITALPTPPSRSDPTNFASRGDAFLGALPTFATECNATAAAINASQVAANNSAIAAAASASAAASTAGVAAWVSGTTYNSGDNVYSLINFLTYRRKITGAGTTDPSADNTNWQLLTGQGDVTSSGANTLTDNLNFSGTGLRIRGDFSNSTLNSRLSFQSSTTDGITYLQVLPNGTGNNSGFSCYGSFDITNTNFGDISNNSAEVRLRSGITGTGTYLPLTFYTGGVERMRILPNGSVLAQNCNGLGYADGSGGTVSQAGNKFSSVSLNKPSGRIIMMDTLLASNSSANFILNNTCINVTDVVVVNIIGGITDINNYQTWVGLNSIGSIQIVLKNISGSSLSEAVIINFIVIKGSLT